MAHREQEKMDALFQQARRESENYESVYEHVLNMLNLDEHGLLDLYYWRPRKSYKNKPDILIIDDDQYIARDYGDILTIDGFKVQYAFTADDALRIAKLFRSDIRLVIVDIRASDRVAAITANFSNESSKFRRIASNNS